MVSFLEYTTLTFCLTLGVHSIKPVETKFEVYFNFPRWAPYSLSHGSFNRHLALCWNR